VSRARIGLFVAVAVILGATLLPAGTRGEAPPQRPQLNWSFPLADMLRNWLLFIPLGAALQARGMRGGRALATGLGLSLAIETLQLGIQGRESAVSDVLSNTLGTGAGIALLRTAPRWISATGSRAERLALGAAAIAVAAMAAAGVLLAPAAWTGLPLFAHHVPQMEHFEPYTGKLLEANLDGTPLPYGELADSHAAGERLRGDFTLRVVAEAGSPPGGLAALLWVTDLAQREILLLGAEAEDLTLRLRSRGHRIGLEPARIRAAGALRGVPVGARIRLEAAREGGDLCLGVDARVDCDLGFTIGDGWSLLISDHRWLAQHRRLLGAAWLGMLLFPLGCWSRPSVTVAAAWGAVIAAVFLTPAFTGLLATPPSELLGAAGGLAAGALAGRVIARRSVSVEARAGSPVYARRE
jgi:hypothetical protein